MSIVHSPPEVHYPSSDGTPMGETPLHQRWMIYIDNILERRYREQRVFRGCNMFVYYVPGDARKSIVPDNFIALGCEPGERDVYKTWEDPPPNVVFEVSSKSTRRKDKQVKPETYVRVGVREIFLYDPRGETQPALSGMRIIDGAIVAIESDARGAIVSEELNVTLRLDGASLVIADRDTGEILHTDCEAYSAELAKMTAAAAAHAAEARLYAAEAKANEAKARASEAQAKASAENAAASERRAALAERRAAAAEEEIRKLRKSLIKRGIDPDA